MSLVVVTSQPRWSIHSHVSPPSPPPPLTTALLSLITSSTGHECSACSRTLVSDTDTGTSSSGTAEVCLLRLPLGVDGDKGITYYRAAAISVPGCNRFPGTYRAAVATVGAAVHTDRATVHLVRVNKDWQEVPPGAYQADAMVKFEIDSDDEHDDEHDNVNDNDNTMAPRKHVMNTDSRVPNDSGMTTAPRPTRRRLWEDTPLWPYAPDLGHEDIKRTNTITLTDGAYPRILQERMMIRDSSSFDLEPIPRAVSPVPKPAVASKPARKRTKAESTLLKRAGKAEAEAHETRVKAEAEAQEEAASKQRWEAARKYCEESRRRYREVLCGLEFGDRFPAPMFASPQSEWERRSHGWEDGQAAPGQPYAPRAGFAPSMAPRQAYPLHAWFPSAPASLTTWPYVCKPAPSIATATSSFAPTSTAATRSVSQREQTPPQAKPALVDLDPTGKQAQRPLGLLTSPSAATAAASTSPALTIATIPGSAATSSSLSLITELRDDVGRLRGELAATEQKLAEVAAWTGGGRQ